MAYQCTFSALPASMARTQRPQHGPGRPRTAIIKPGQVFSRIHVDDITTVLRASIGQPQAGKAYNLCDDEAAPPQDVIAYAYSLLEVDAPPEIPFENAELSDMARSFYQDNKRVSNAGSKTTSAFTSHGQPIGRDCRVF